jgi:hypothetical protein
LNPATQGARGGEEALSVGVGGSIDEQQHAVTLLKSWSRRNLKGGGDARTDGVSFKLDVPGARFIGLASGDVAIGPRCWWTALALRPPEDQGKGLLPSRTTIQVLAEGTPDVHDTPDWKALPGLARRRVNLASKCAGACHSLAA